MNLKCPNLLTIFDMKSSDSGDSFVVMEYVAGPSLASVLKQYPGGMPLPEVRRWLRGLVEGVAYLHDHGIVHRDLKPANLFMEEGIVKIGDYGLAKLITPSQGTEHSESIGTCHYMAPEIGSGKYNKPIDIYAMGVILYEMLTGRVPFDGETVNEVLMKHLTARPDISMLAEPYRTIVSKALAKDPNQRTSRVYDLLPPEDAPRQPEVRIIGDGKIGRRGSSGEPAGGGNPADRGRGAGVLHRPGNPPAPNAPGSTSPSGCGRCGPGPQRLAASRGQRPAGGVRGSGSASAAAPVDPAAARRCAAPVRRTVAPTRPPFRLPLRHRSRHRCPASESDSPSWPAPCSGPPRSWPCWPIPAVAALGIDPAHDPQQLAYLFGMALLGTWIALIPNKAVETRRLDRGGRRLIALAAGLAVGGAGIAMSVLRLDSGLTAQREFISYPNPVPWRRCTSGCCTRSRPPGRPSRPATARRGSASCRSSGRRCCPRH